ncbi:formate dehydrogenase accessory sulfurtransferase FdhD [Uliginosibacterium paludis]|uniref:Sulfur carrier protein FdhD n=1 Tax=Uliginosibacterium paludis TaxID=1615952 RepID=A0ABV2CS72_9RHOO
MSDSCRLPPCDAGADGELRPPAPSAVLQVVRMRAAGRTAVEDEVLEEVPVALSYNGVSHAVMLATPSDLEDFALGFSISEGIVSAPQEIHDMEILPGPDGIVIEMRIATPRFLALKDARRTLAGRTGCGLCGVERLAQAIRPVPERPKAGAPIALAAIDEALRQLPHWQPLRELTGASHAAAWVDAGGQIRLVREDAGRHNALDKLGGALLRSGLPVAEGFVLTSSRASYEMVHKAASIGATALIAVSAPTALAIRTAAAAGILLAGFARPGQLVAYTDAERLSGELPSADASRTFM